MLYFDELPKASTRKVKRKETMERVVLILSGGE